MNRAERIRTIRVLPGVETHHLGEAHWRLTVTRESDRNLWDVLSQMFQICAAVVCFERGLFHLRKIDHIFSHYLLIAKSNRETSRTQSGPRSNSDSWKTQWNWTFWLGLVIQSIVWYTGFQWTSKKLRCREKIHWIENRYISNLWKVLNGDFKFRHLKSALKLYFLKFVLGSV